MVRHQATELQLWVRDGQNPQYTGHGADPGMRSREHQGLGGQGRDYLASSREVVFSYLKKQYSCARKDRLLNSFWKPHGKENPTSQTTNNPSLLPSLGL